MSKTRTQSTTNGQSSNTDSGRWSGSSYSTATRSRLRWVLAVLLIVTIAASLLKFYTDWGIARLEQEQQQSQQESQQQASNQKLLVGTLNADRMEAEESDSQTLRVSGQATIDELMAHTANAEDLETENLTAEEGNFDTLLIKGARIAHDFQVSGNTTLADLLLQGQLKLTGSTEDMVLLEPGGNDQSVFSVRTPSGEETANLNTRGDLRLAGDADISGVLRVSRNAAFNADVLIKGGLVAQELVQFRDSLRVGQNATFKSDVWVEQNMDVQESVTAGNAAVIGDADLQGPISNTGSNNQGRVYVDDDFEATGTMYGTDLVLSGSVTQGDTTINNLTVLGTADFLGPATMSDELTIGTDTFYADPANNRVGIGTTNPSQFLHVAGNSLIDNELTVNESASIANNLDIGGDLTVSGQGNFTGTVAGSDATISGEFVTLGQLNDGSSTNAFVQGGNSFGALATLGTNDTNALALETGGTERVRIDTSGNMGISNTNPSEKLSVGDPTVSTNAFIGIGSAGKTSEGIKFRRQTATDASIFVDNEEDLTLTYQRSDLSGRKLRIKRGSNGINVAIFNNTGNFGLGTTTPAQGLTLGSDGTHRNLLLSRENTATSTTQYPSNDLILQGSVWDSTNSVAEDRTITIKTITGSGSDGSEPYRLAIQNNAGNEFVTFDGANRRMGVGTSSPNSKLHASGGTGSVNLLLEADNDNFGESNQPSLTFSQDGGAIRGKAGFFDGSNNMSVYSLDKNLTLGAGGTKNHVYIQGNGDVGVGTTSPNTTFDVNGNVRIRGDDLRFGGGEQISAGNNFILSSDSGFIDLRSTNNVHSLIIRDSDGSSLSWSGIRTQDNGRMELRADDASYKQFQLRDSGDVTMHDGNLGIGTSLPAEGLTLGRDGIHRNLLLSRKNTATDTTQYPSNDLTLQGSVWDSTNAVAENRRITLKTIAGSGSDGSEPYRLAVQNNAGTEFVTFDGNNRRVGIGTAKPGGIFTVNNYPGGTYGYTMRHQGNTTTFRGSSSSTEGSVFRIKHRGSNETSIRASELHLDNVVRINGRGGLGLATASGGHHKMNMIVDGSSSMFLDGSNNSRLVGIGTTNPGARLQVNTKGGGIVGQIIKGADSQSADLLQAKDSNGNVLTSIDATGNLSVKDATVNGTLTVNGVAVVDGVRTTLATKTADYTLTDGDSIILADASGGAITITLPTASGRKGREFTIKKIDGSTNNVTVATDGSETIDGSSSHDISSEDHFLQVVSNGSNWFVIGIAPSL